MQNCILIARVGANAGTLYRVKGYYNVSDNTLMLYLNNKSNLEFIYSYLIKFNLNKLVFGSGQPLITGGQLKNISVLLPSLTEQKKIGSFFQNIDSLINLHQKKYDKLVVLKISNYSHFLFYFKCSNYIKATSTMI